ncbi:PepSY domain-containing protein [Halomonas sp. PAMB 3264]|uniref:PepSY-associated TM helix domain-containing protein n=1 Tax=Halomonas sp. PAMB 3264 TaxID=3075222 RepID=UPI002898A3EF|nr:PepSY domain-containing protein [Halomonas sp. PAMB 3264]WNL42564.1 PepSY domain-containing protein [Halomonas sp. PAMB 3264]
MTAHVDPRSAAKTPFDLYRAIWRWHFYAGLLVLPFLITLSITGALYLFKDEIDAIVHADVKRVAVQQSVQTPAAQVSAALDAHPGTALKYTAPATPESSAEVTVRTTNDERLAVYVNPYTGRVLGALDDRGTIMWTVRKLHSFKLFGATPRKLIEITGGFAILLVLTGVYLWWPRTNARGGVVSVRGAPQKRVFWRDLHAVTGLFVGAFILFLAITGMPWSGVWGAQVNQWANGNNFGYPAGVRTEVPMSSTQLSEQAPTSWSLEQAQVPESTESTESTGQADIGLNEAVATFERLGLHSGFAVSLPTTPTGVYSGSVYPDDVSQQRVVHLDRYSGEPLVDMRYADYGPLGRWLEFGINVHMGQQFGRANQLLFLAVCVAIILLCVSAGVMWWKRRPKGGLGVPPLPRDKRAFRGILAILVGGGVLFPLTGAAILVMLLIDGFVVRPLQQRRLAARGA